MRPSPLLSAAAAVALLGGLAGPAVAATEPAPARGAASSSVTLFGVTAGGHTVTAGTLELLSEMLGGETVAKVLLTPLTADGTAYGQQTVTPAESPMTAPSVDSSALVPALTGIASVRSPVLQATADDSGGEPSTTAEATSLGGVSVLGLPVSLDGALDVGSVVTKAGATGEKTLRVENLALPSIADVLAALGLDLSALPIEVLTELLKELDLVNDTVDQAQKALDDAMAAIQAQVDAAQAEVDKAAADLDAALTELAGKESELAAAEQQLQTQTAALNDAKAVLAAAQTELAAAQAEQTTAQATYDEAYATVKAAADLLGLTVQQFVDANSTLDIVVALKAAETTLAAANDSVASATAAVDQAAADVASAQSLVDATQATIDLLKAAIATLQTTIDGLQAILDAALAALRDILDQVQAELDALLGAITAVLDGTPLVSFDSLAVVTQAVTTSNQEGGQSATITGGEISGLRVLGTDVLSNVLGTTSVDLLDLADAQLSAVNALIADLTATLSNVLSTVPEFPTLSIPAPEVGLLTKSTSTGVEDGFGVASTSVKGLSITLPSVTIPSALALPGAADLPALNGVTQVAGLLTSAPVALELATLSSNSAFSPALTAAPGTQAPGTQVPGNQLPSTGASQALAVLGVALLGAALVARRRRGEGIEDVLA